MNTLSQIQVRQAQAVAKNFLKDWNDRPTSRNTRTFTKSTASQASGDLEILQVKDLTNFFDQKRSFLDPSKSPPLELFSDDSDYEELKQKRDERLQFMNDGYSRISGHSDVSSGSSGILRELIIKNWSI